jgi:TIR domain-containing protein
MATIRDLFDSDPKILTYQQTWSANVAPDSQEVVAKIACDFEANSKYWYFFVPPTEELAAYLNAIFAFPFLMDCRFADDGTEFGFGFSTYSERFSFREMQFSRRIHLYVDAEFAITERALLRQQALSRGYFLSIRDREYARLKSALEKPLAFISHDTRDKESFVRALVSELGKQLCPVWYDEYSLKVGDSLRENIERGLRETKKCVVVLSSNFLSNSGWSKAEFDSIYIREIVEKQNVILPIWLDVTQEDVYRYSPRLADKVGLKSSLGIPEIASKIAQALKS